MLSSSSSSCGVTLQLSMSCCFFAEVQFCISFFFFFTSIVLTTVLIEFLNIKLLFSFIVSIFKIKIVKYSVHFTAIIYLSLSVNYIKILILHILMELKKIIKKIISTYPFL